MSPTVPSLDLRTQSRLQSIRYTTLHLCIGLYVCIYTWMYVVCMQIYVLARMYVSLNAFMYVNKLQNYEFYYVYL